MTDDIMGDSAQPAKPAQSDHPAHLRPSVPEPFPLPLPRTVHVLPGAFLRKGGVRTNGRRDPGLVKDSLFTVKRGDTLHIISENYFYKTEPYYTILNHELEGEKVRPSSTDILDAYVVPICLERAKLAGIPVCEWEISQAYVPLPSIIYGLNYFATTSDFFAVSDAEHAKEVIKHVTNKGKYPFCYQRIGEEATIHSCPAIFGKTNDACSVVAPIAEKIYETFSMPLVRMIMVRTGNRYELSSLSPMRYSQMTDADRALLLAYIAHQEFL
jgi:hypothetical protein